MKCSKDPRHPSFVGRECPLCRGLSAEDILEAVRLALSSTTNGCAFAGERKWQKGLSCGQDTGRGFDCYACRAIALCEKLGLEYQR